MSISQVFTVLDTETWSLISSGSIRFLFFLFNDDLLSFVQNIEYLFFSRSRDSRKALCRVEPISSGHS